MSYILEALKKAELQRDIGQVPGIGSEHEKPPRSVNGTWLAIVAGFLALNLVLLVWLLWPQADQGPADAGGGDRPVQRDSAVPLPGQVPVVPPPAPPVVEAPVRPRSVLPQPVGTATPARMPPVAQPAPPVARPALPAVVLPEPAPLPEPPAMEPQAAPPAASLPVWPQIPDHLFRQLRGGMRMDVHVYSDQPQDRFVLINLQKYHVGDRLQEGPLVDEITPEGVILSFQGQQFMVRAQ
ncbi:MAG TPA: hypothetical protein ENK49_10960 [Gammaproteobacteria bacterium]|nr:hypothetical protein [Gammaproteobacteria bacterium]